MHVSRISQCSRAVEKAMKLQHMLNRLADLSPTAGATHASFHNGVPPEPPAPPTLAPMLSARLSGVMPPPKPPSLTPQLSARLSLSRESSVGSRPPSRGGGDVKNAEEASAAAVLAEKKTLELQHVADDLTQQLCAQRFYGVVQGGGKKRAAKAHGQGGREAMWKLDPRYLVFEFAFDIMLRRRQVPASLRLSLPASVPHPPAVLTSACSTTSPPNLPPSLLPARWRW